MIHEHPLSDSWKTKPTDRFILKWIKCHFSARVTPKLIRFTWIRPWMITLCSAVLGTLGGVVFALGWGRRKLEQFQAMALKTELLWERPMREKGLSGTDIRRRIVSGVAWKHLIPPSTHMLLRKWGVLKRLRELYTS